MWIQRFWAFYDSENSGILEILRNQCLRHLGAFGDSVGLEALDSGILETLKILNPHEISESVLLKILRILKIP